QGRVSLPSQSTRKRATTTSRFPEPSSKRHSFLADWGTTASKEEEVTISCLAVTIMIRSLPTAAAAALYLSVDGEQTNSTPTAATICSSPAHSISKTHRS